jgi:ferritin
MSLNLEIVQALQSQVTMERTNSAFYDALRTEARNQYYKGVAKFFKKSLKDELHHAHWIISYLQDQGQTYAYEPLPDIPPVGGESLTSWFDMVLAKEQETTVAINKLSLLATELDDPSTEEFLDKLVKEQYKSVGKIANILKELRRTGPDGWLILDKRIGKMKP